MKKFLIAVILVQAILASTFATAGDIVAYMKMASFNAASGQSYMETYLNVQGSSVIFKMDSNKKWQGKVNVTVLFKRQDSVVLRSSYNLCSPELDDSLKRVDFLDVQRYMLPAGEYTFQITLLDKNNPAGKPISKSQKVTVGFKTDTISISDAEFLASYTPSAKKGMAYKNGYKLIPYVNDFYPDAMNEINFYAEIYNTVNVLGDKGKFILKYFIESYETHNKLNEYSSVSIKSADTTTALIAGFNIASLPSGRYLVVIEVLDKDNHIRAIRSYPFLRHNGQMDLNLQRIAMVNTANTFVDKITNHDSLFNFIKWLQPISNFEEKNFEMNLDTQKVSFALQKQFFYNIWQARDKNDPESAWLTYKFKVMDVNKEFGAMNTKGYQTDRGRVYLQYGAPNQRVMYDMNPNSYPYEIWQYYQLNDGETDRKFVFYDPDLVDNNYLLLYSNARGEIQDRRWQQILQGRSEYGRSTEGNIDNNSTPDPFGEFTQDQFANPH